MSEMGGGLKFERSCSHNLLLPLISTSASGLRKTAIILCMIEFATLKLVPKNPNKVWIARHERAFIALDLGIYKTNFIFSNN